MSDKVKCPICGETIEFVPHPDKPGRQVAYCTCRGGEVAVVETETTPSARASFKEKGE